MILTQERGCNPGHRTSVIGCGLCGAILILCSAEMALADRNTGAQEHRKTGRSFSNIQMNGSDVSLRNLRRELNVRGTVFTNKNKLRGL